MAFGDDPFADRGIHRTVQVLEQQRERITVGQSPDGELWEPGQDLVADRCPGGAHDRHPFGEEPAGDEREDLCRGLIEPLGVVDEADERLLLGDLGEQRQVSPGRPGTGRVPARRSARRSSPARCAEVAAAARGDRAWVHRADAARCKPAPSPTRHPRRGRHASAQPAGRRMPATRSSRCRLRRAAPAPHSDRRRRPSRADRGPGTRDLAPGVSSAHSLRREVTTAPVRAIQDGAD